jgi:transposase
MELGYAKNSEDSPKEPYIPILTRGTTVEDPIYGELLRDEANRRIKYREFVKGMMRTKEAMRGEMGRQVIYGSEVFAGKLKKAYEMEEMIKPKGRPKKEPK